RFHITFAAGDLARETDMGARLQSQRLVEKRGRVQKRVAVEAAKPRKLGLLQARDGAKGARLLAVFHLGLEADHVEERAKRIILPELDDRIGLDRRVMRIGEAPWLH